MEVKQEPSLEAVSSVEEYFRQSPDNLSSRFPSISAIMPMRGGGVNFTYRVHFGEPFKHRSHGRQRQHNTAILKHYSPNIAATPQFTFNNNRQCFEALALKEIPKFTASEATLEHVRIPDLFWEDDVARVIIMEDVIPPARLEDAPSLLESMIFRDFCKTANESPEKIQIACQVGSALGQYLALLHTLDHGPVSTAPRALFAHHVEARRVCALTAFGDFLGSLDRFGVELEIDQRHLIQEVMGGMTEEMLTDEDTLVMGDFWFGNIIIGVQQTYCSGSKTLSNPTPPTDSTSSIHSIHIIDWEFVTYAPRYLDLAHFAAECWLYNHFYPSTSCGGSIYQQLTSSLFKAYRTSGGTIDVQRVIYYIAGHVGCFLGYSNRWTDNPIVRKAKAKLAVKMIEDAQKKDWEALRKDEFLLNLFDEEDYFPESMRG
ncbi:hypothetical protein B7494_g5860 [Chlorociboria aeruginascens]|nr:hypothetical protein B7494_g5860 [Chlorociboria aeruginascens]